MNLIGTLQFELRLLESRMIADGDREEVFNSIQWKFDILEDFESRFKEMYEKEVKKPSERNTPTKSDSEPAPPSESTPPSESGKQLQIQLDSTFRKASRHHHPDRGGSGENFDILAKLRESKRFGALERIANKITSPSEELLILKLETLMSKSHVIYGLMTPVEKKNHQTLFSK